MPLDAEYVGKINQAAMKALGDLDVRRKWADSKQGSPVTTNILCAEIARLNMVNEKLFIALREMSEWWAYAMEKPPGAEPDRDDQKKVEQLAEQAINALHAADPSYTQRLAAERAALSSGE